MKAPSGRAPGALSLGAMMDDAHYMALALAEAEAAAGRGEVPIGAVLVEITTGAVVARDGNRTLELSDPTAHAEVQVIRARCREVGSQRIPGHALYVTLEPCTQCAASIAFARIDRLVYAAPDPKGGGVAHGARFYELATCHHRPEVRAGDGAEAAGELLRSFFRARREAAKERRPD